MVTAPRGVNLREAISQALSSPHLQPEPGSASLPQSQQWGSLPGSPTSLPGGPGLCPAAVPDGWQPGTSAAPALQEAQQADGTPEGLLGLAPLPGAAGAEQQSASDWQWLLRSRFHGGNSLDPGGGSGQPSPATRPPAPPGAAATAAAPPAKLQGSAWDEAEPRQRRPRATTLDQLELLAEAPAARLEGARPWSLDGTEGSLAVPRGALKPSPLEVAYRARAAGEAHC